MKAFEAAKNFAGKTIDAVKNVKGPTWVKAGVGIAAAAVMAVGARFLLKDDEVETVTETAAPEAEAEAEPEAESEQE